MPNLNRRQYTPFSKGRFLSPAASSVFQPSPKRGFETQPCRTLAAEFNRSARRQLRLWQARQFRLQQGKILEPVRRQRRLRNRLRISGLSAEHVPTMAAANRLIQVANVEIRVTLTTRAGSRKRGRRLHNQSVDLQKIQMAKARHSVTYRSETLAT